MSILFDILAVAVIAIFALRCYKAGFAATVFSAVAGFISVTVAVTLSAPVADYVYTTRVEPMAVAAISTEVNEKFGGDFNAFRDYVAGITTTEQENVVRGLLENAGLPEGLDVLKSIDEAKNEGGEIDIGDSVSAAAAKLIKPIMIFPLKLLIFVVFFAIISMVSVIIVRLLRKANKIRLIGAVNRAAGLVLGVVCGIVAVFVMAGVSSGFIALSGNNNDIVNYNSVTNSFLFSHFYRVVAG